MDKPEFLKTTRNVTVSVGETAFLPCRVKHLSSHTVNSERLKSITIFIIFQVSWVRASDVSVLSVGHLAFSSDARIGVVQVSLSFGDNENSTVRSLFQKEM